MKLKKIKSLTVISFTFCLFVLGCRGVADSARDRNGTYLSSGDRVRFTSREGIYPSLDGLEGEVWSCEYWSGGRYSNSEGVAVYFPVQERDAIMHPNQIKTINGKSHLMFVVPIGCIVKI